MSDVARASKPVMRRLLHNQIKKNLIIAIAVCTATGLAQKFLINEPAKQRYADFYKTYDIEKEFNEMRQKGLFDSCK